MKMTKWLSAGILATAVLINACSKDENTNTTLNSTDQTFLLQASNSNYSEITLGQLASTKGNDTIALYSQVVVQDHQGAKIELDSIATQYHVTLSPALDSTSLNLKTMLDSLAAGRAFDSTYINGDIQTHQQTISLFQTQLNNGSNQQLKDYVNKYLPHLQLQLHMADSIKTILQ
jgi:putative membrane protein